jgi:succinate dehydrogenase/fumarate reductase flavoprotein subunit
MDARKADVLVIGSGGAGVMAAVEAARAGASVILVSKEPVGYGNTRISNGSISVSPDPSLGDSEELFVEDMLRGGEYLNDRKLVQALVREAMNGAINFEGFGHIFSRDEEGAIQREPVPFGGHRARRTVGSPGRGVSMAHSLRAAAARADIQVIEETVCSELLVAGDEVVGAAAVGIMTGEPVVLLAKSTVLAAGGAGYLYYPHTDCTPSTGGDSYGLGLMAGVELVDMEQVQFIPFGITHPTSMVGIACGEPVTAGPFGRLLNNKGEVVGENIMSMARAQAARVIIDEISRGGATEHGGLLFDLSPNRQHPEGRAFLDSVKRMMPFILGNIRRAYGQKAAAFEEPWDVLPTAHYNMGGIRTDEWCRTRVAGLSACGQAQGGVMGGDRLGSTSLSEIFVFGKRAGRAAADDARERALADDRLAHEAIERLRSLRGAKGAHRPIDLKKRLRELTWEKIGPLRDADGLQEALDGIEAIRKDSEDLCVAELKECNFDLLDAIELPHMLATAEAMAISSLERRESRGAHVRSDFPERDDLNPVTNMVVDRHHGRCRLRTMEAGQ